MGSAADLASVVGSCGKFRCSLLLVDHGLLSHLNSPLLLERSAHQLKEHLGLFVSLSGCNKSDVHTAYLVDFIVLDLREDKLLLQTEGKVAAAIEAIGADTSEVSYTGL